MKLTNFVLVLAALTLSGCDALMTQNQPASRPKPLSLSSDVRRSLEQRFDVDALEEYLRGISPAEQEAFLAQIDRPNESAGSETVDISVPMRSTDPARQALLERVWAPFWDQLPLEALDRADLPFPGRELARARRAARLANEEP